MKTSTVIVIQLLFTCLLNSFQHTWAQQYCYSSANYCFQVTFPTDNTTSNQNYVSFRLEAPSNIGWVGLGIGSSMLQSYLMIAWPNSDNSITISQRKATSYNTPQVTSQQSDLTLDPSSGITGGKMVVIINRPLSVSGSTLKPGSTQSFVWAFSSVSPNNASPDASLTQHDNRGYASLSLVSGTSGNSGTSGTSADGSISLSDSSGLTKEQKIIISHGVFMFAAYIISAPTAIYIARFGRSHLPSSWFHLHWSIQLFLTTILAIIGYVLIEFRPHSWSSGSIKRAHSNIGGIIFYGTIAQVILGWIHHRLFKADRGYTPWWTILHWWVGRIIVILAFIQVPFGFVCYGVSTGIYVGYYVVVGIWVASFLILSARSYVQQRKAENSSNEIKYF